LAKTYVLIADASRARLFQQAAQHYALLETFDHQPSRVHNRDLVADVNGRRTSGPSIGGSFGGRSVSRGVGRPGVAPDIEPKEVEAAKFAHELATMLADTLRDQGDRLVLAAPPHFLGLLKKTLSASVVKRVGLTVDKDLTKVDGRELDDRMHNELFLAPKLR
jgi:protein required for attachment to host cells